jgi:hypothetical protein
MMLPLLRVVTLIMACVLVAASAAAEVKTVRDWTGECDDDLFCTATASGAGGMVMGGTGYQVLFTRSGGDVSWWSMRFFLNHVPQPKAEGEMVISVDGGEPISFYEEAGFLRDADGVTFGLAGGDDLTKLFGAIKKGRKLELSYETPDGKKQEESFSLLGLAAVLLWIDERQNRVGKSSEISDPGGVEGEATFTATKEILDKIAARVKFDCEPPVPNRPDVESYRLPGGSALHIAPCFAGAYNFTQLYFYQERDDLQLLYFADYYDGWSGTNQLFNSEFDPKTGWLSSAYKARGVGGCGSAGQWVWSGGSFKLVEYSAWADCDNSRDEWPIIYKREAK